MSRDSVKKIFFVRDVYIPWESGRAGLLKTDEGAYFSEVDLAHPPPKTLIEIRMDPRTGVAVMIALREREGTRSVLVPVALTYQYCETSNIEVPIIQTRQ